MTEELRKKIKDLRRELLFTQQANVIKNQLLTQREKFEEKIHSLLELIEKKTFNSHRMKPHETDEISEYREVLRRIRQKKKELDSKLDEFEHHSEELSSKLEKELIHAILELHPQEKENLHKLTISIEKNQKKGEEVEQCLSYLMEIEGFLSIIQHERQSFQKRGILRYIFGPNPNVIITKMLLKIQNSINQALPYYQHIQFRQQEPDLIKNLIQTLTQLLEVCKKRWGFKQIDKEIIPFISQIETLKNTISIIEKDVSNESIKMQLQKQKWIEKQSITDL